MLDVGQKARSASRALAKAESGTKNAALFTLADRLIEESESILEANREIIASADRVAEGQVLRIPGSGPGTNERPR